jgi:hypothetical protein
MKLHTIFGLALVVASVASVLLLSDSATAQTAVSVEISKAQLRWEWTKGSPPNDGDVEFFLMRCGNQPGNYIKETAIASPTARSLPIKDAITGSGNWFCVVLAGNQFGESGPSNEVAFKAGTRPNSAVLEIVSQ